MLGEIITYHIFHLQSGVPKHFVNINNASFTTLLEKQELTFNEAGVRSCRLGAMPTVEDKVVEWGCGKAWPDCRTGGGLGQVLQAHMKEYLTSVTGVLKEKSWTYHPGLDTHFILFAGLRTTHNGMFIQEYEMISGLYRTSHQWIQQYGKSRSSIMVRSSHLVQLLCNNLSHILLC